MKNATLLRLLLAFAPKQYEVARAINCSQAYLSMLANNDVIKPEPMYLRRLSAYFSERLGGIEIPQDALLRNVSPRSLLIAALGVRPYGS